MGSEAGVALEEERSVAVIVLWELPLLPEQLAARIDILKVPHKDRDRATGDATEDEEVTAEAIE